MGLGSTSNSPPPLLPPQHREEHTVYGYPTEPYYVILDSAPAPQRRSNGRFLTYAVCGALSIVMIAVAAYFLWPSDPRIEVVRIRLNKIDWRTEKSSGSFLPHLFLDLSMGLTVKVKNRDYLGVYNDYLKVGIAYRGEKIGRVTSVNSAYIPPRGTAYVDATLDIEGFQVLADVIYLLEDIAHGHIPLQTITNFDGYIRLFSLKVPLQAIMSCEVVVDTNQQTVLRQECDLG